MRQMQDWRRSIWPPRRARIGMQNSAQRVSKFCQFVSNLRQKLLPLLEAGSLHFGLQNAAKSVFFGAFLSNLCGDCHPSVALCASFLRHFLYRFCYIFCVSRIAKSAPLEPKTAIDFGEIKRLRLAFPIATMFHVALKESEK